MEWVYNEPIDEPTVYEADAITVSEKSSTKPIDIFSSRKPVEEPVSEPDTEAEYYGDEDIIEDRVSPIKAFETFAGRNFPVGRIPDFSGSIYAEASDAVVKPMTSIRQPHQLPSSESRSQRLARLSAEVEALKAEYGSEDEGGASDAFAQLSSLRDQLSQIENSISSSVPSTRNGATILPTRTENKDSVNREEVDGGISLQFVSPNVSVLSGLEKRVATLETTVGVCELEDNCDGAALGPLLEDVRTRLGFVTDNSLPQKLKRDAQDIAGILQNELQQERGAEMLRAATALEKMEQWQHLADIVPLVVERLRSLKRVQEEAQQFSTTLAAIGTEVDNLEQRSITNSGLIENVRTSLSINLKTVQENLDMLTEKLTALESKG